MKSCGWGEVKRILDAIDGSEEICEQGPAARAWDGEVSTVRIDVLAEERHLDESSAGQRLDLGQDVADRTGQLRAPDEGHDAERAAVVAADAHRNPRVVSGRAAGRKRAGKDLSELADVHLGALARGLPDQIEQPGKGVGSDDDVHPRCLPLDQALILLR